MCVFVCMRAATCALFEWVHWEPHATTLAVNYIMPFNSSTPKIDGYYNSSVSATAGKRKRKKEEKKRKNSAGISQMRRLSSGWDQGLRLYSNNRNLLSSAVSQSHVNTVHTSYSQHRHRGKEKKKKKKTSHFKHSPASEEHEWSHSPPSPPPLTQTKLIHYTFRMTIYTIHKWYRTAPFSKCKKIKKKRRERERKVVVLFLITAQ